MPNLAVLVDVDKTLLIDEQGNLNESLVKALKKQGLTKIYLFTSMSLNDIVDKLANPHNTSRPDLIAKLKKAGITVKGVLTPADVTYKQSPGHANKQGLGQAYNDIYAPQYARLVSGKLTVDNYSTDKEFINARKQYSDLHDALRASIKDNKVTDKSLLFVDFVENTPEECDTIIVIDDDKRHLDAITIAATQYPDTTVKCVQVVEGAEYENYLQALSEFKVEKSFIKSISSKLFSHKTEQAAPVAPEQGAASTTSLAPSAGKQQD